MITIRCHDRHENSGKCGCVVATIRNGVLVLQSEHNGQPHVAVVTLADLQRLMVQDKEQREPALRPY